jgi:lytic cellulose monooxygenase (C1-hydroxylating)
MPGSSLIAFLAGAATAAAHGYINNIIIDGQSYVGYNPTIAPWTPDQDSIGWKNWATNTGYVPFTSLQSSDIICHLDSGNAPRTATVAAGSEIMLGWTDWPRSHHGPVIDYLARCNNGDCTTADKTQLRFFKVAQKGQISLGEGGGKTGYWASDEFIDAGSDWIVKIPSDIAPGSYVLRHEQIALHEGSQAGGAQFYPQCINLEITGGGSKTPSGVPATQLYTADHSGVHYNYNDETSSSYQIPGPSVS